jgi:hypothetical protein
MRISPFGTASMIKQAECGADQKQSGKAVRVHVEIAVSNRLVATVIGCPRDSPMVASARGLSVAFCGWR